MPRSEAGSRSRRRTITGGAVALLLLAVLGWLAVRGVAARDHLASARTQLTATEAALRDGRLSPGDPDLGVRIALAVADTAAAISFCGGGVAPNISEDEAR